MTITSANLRTNSNKVFISNKQIQDAGGAEEFSVGKSVYHEDVKYTIQQSNASVPKVKCGQRFNNPAHRNLLIGGVASTAIAFLTHAGGFGFLIALAGPMLPFALLAVGLVCIGLATKAPYQPENGEGGGVTLELEPAWDSRNLQKMQPQSLIETAEFMRDCKEPHSVIQESDTKALKYVLTEALDRFEKALDGAAKVFEDSPEDNPAQVQANTAANEAKKVLIKAILDLDNPTQAAIDAANTRYPDAANPRPSS